MCVRSTIFFSAILWDLEGLGRGRRCPYTTHSSCVKIGNNPINQGTPAGAITFRGWTQLAEPNPSRKYCPLRTDAAFSPDPPLFLSLSVFISFFTAISRPCCNAGDLPRVQHAGVVDDTCTSSPLRASRPCSFITARRSLLAHGYYNETMGTVVAWSVRIFSGSLIATVRSVNSRVSAWESELRSEREDLSLYRRREDSKGARVCENMGVETRWTRMCLSPMSREYKSKTERIEMFLTKYIKQRKFNIFKKKIDSFLK